MKIHTLDLHFQGHPQAIASYLLEAPDGPVVIESGPMSTLKALKERLAEHGLQPADVRHVFVTHIHLDHAGAAGWWANQGARVYVHPAGAPHLLDPSKLWQSAGRIYGDEMEILWGEIIPAPAEQIVVVEDNEVVDAAGLQITALATPGHASHHHTYVVEDAAFTGDAAGVRLPGSPWVALPAPPPEFKMEVWEETLKRLGAQTVDAFYPTHFGRVEDWKHQLDQLWATMGAATAFIRRLMEAGVSREEIIRRYAAWNREQAEATGMPPHVFDVYEAANPLFMSVDGIVRYWRKKAEREEREQEQA
ncbi:MAG: MBL fold metallo-hydrolase [Candidatus Promineifilaceae bacterium]|nr:MBL fold metallo-hydrolase [Candidatus Promineifilaceae bacterium]